MAESSSSAVPGDVEWQSGRVLRAPAGVLVLSVAGGGEVRLEPRAAGDYEVPLGLDWTAAWLVRRDGVRVPVPAPAGEVIELRPRVAPPVESRPPAWTTPPQLAESAADAEALWRTRREELERALAEAAGAVGRAREDERAAREAVLAALAAARADLRAARAAREADASALAALSGELDAERSAHAVTRGSVGTLADALASARADADRLRAELAAASAEAEALRAELAAASAATAEAEALRTELAAAVAATPEAEALRGELAAASSATPEAEALRAQLADATARAEAAEAEAGALRRTAELDRVAATGRRDALERAAREQAEAAEAARRPASEATRLLADLDAAAAALRAAIPSTPESSAPASPALDAAVSPDAPTAPDGLAAPGAPAAPGRDALPTGIEGEASPPGGLAPRRDRAAGHPPAPDAPEPTPSGLAASGPAAPPPRPGAPTPPDAGPAPSPGPSASSSPGDRRLRRALVELARADAATAGALLAALAPAQAAALDEPLEYDLTIRGIGTFAISIDGGTATATPRERPRKRRDTRFHLSAEPLALAQLLAGDRRKARRFGRAAKLTGRHRRQARTLHEQLANASLSFADAAQRTTLEPALVLAALPYAIDPAWTRGHRFTVAQRIASRAWYITAHNGSPLTVVEGEERPADATVTFTRGAFDSLLRDEPPPPGELPTVRGDLDAVAALKRWTDRARRG
ncbi:MAG TPA: hypothetical protein VNS09_27945 [Solirubrobacter sp.]|nr:hypothetical protein [Solirubrobacter sp.]